MQTLSNTVRSELALVDKVFRFNSPWNQQAALKQAELRVLQHTLHITGEAIRDKTIRTQWDSITFLKHSRPSVAVSGDSSLSVSPQIKCSLCRLSGHKGPGTPHKSKSTFTNLHFAQVHLRKTDVDTQFEQHNIWLLQLKSLRTHFDKELSCSWIRPFISSFSL